MYNHFAYTLIFAIVAALAFMVWLVNFPKNGCLEVWNDEIVGMGCYMYPYRVCVVGMIGAD